MYRDPLAGPIGVGHSWHSLWPANGFGTTPERRG